MAAPLRSVHATSGQSTAPRLAAAPARAPSLTSARAIAPAQSLPALCFASPASAAVASTSTSTSTSTYTGTRPRIHSDAQLAHWMGNSAAHRLLVLLVERLCEAAVGCATMACTSHAAPTNAGIAFVMDVLQELDKWTAEIQPHTGSQRFGNLAFRQWGARLQQRVDDLHKGLPERIHAHIPDLCGYLLGSFGSWVRIDYGSGHELAFLAWLLALIQLGLFGDVQGDDAEPVKPAEGARGQVPMEVDADADADAIGPLLAPQGYERELATRVLPAYLRTVWSLQDRYGLEPAGSHGVWGLDDYHFVPYIIGAAQLRLQSEYRPQEIAASSHKPAAGSFPCALLAFRGTAPLPNLFTSSIARIHVQKRGPFREHSPLLENISATVPNWVKLHQGMIKMWKAECLAKLPVVQHLPFGTVGLVWDGGENCKKVGVVGATTRIDSTNLLPARGGATTAATVPTGAPWAKATASASGAPRAHAPAPASGAPRAHAPPSASRAQGSTYSVSGPGARIAKQEQKVSERQ
ncbi:Phosphotyrosyl phosphatase activator [Ceraceosorus bombacis]|uniref:Serine/threonine-protein phosphatase 2A activator n=1 Tax=Ceraceosorus bombacis TaxID=401625 RepID=A0A0P1B722_9BASI|nr:Phosphotyrosyl phosphatase activator [Ceraceosorus bombacis]